jgi:serine/threonine protein phosphatase PrpC
LINIWDKIFNRDREKDASKEDTIPIKRDSTGSSEQEITKPLHTPLMGNKKSSDHYFLLCTEPPQLQASCSNSKGLQRPHNEDAMFCLTTTLSYNGGTTPFGLYIVADGMGGHQNGEVASEIATRTMADHIIRELLINLISINPQPPDGSLQEILQQGLTKAHEAIIQSGTSGGTTLSTVAVFNKIMTIAHIGDSRVYSIDLSGCIIPLTRDHSLVRRLEELGQLTPDEAAVDPRRNVLYHALGQSTPLEPEVISTPIPETGYLLVCSDGLWGVLPEEQIVDIVMNTGSLPTTCQRLVDAANEAGGPDNISAILIRLPIEIDA